MAKKRSRNTPPSVKNSEETQVNSEQNTEQAQTEATATQDAESSDTTDIQAQLDAEAEQEDGGQSEDSPEAEALEEELEPEFNLFVTRKQLRQAEIRRQSDAVDHLRQQTSEHVEFVTIRVPVGQLETDADGCLKKPPRRRSPERLLSRDQSLAFSKIFEGLRDIGAEIPRGQCSNKVVDRSEEVISYLLQEVVKQIESAEKN